VSILKEFTTFLNLKAKEFGLLFCFPLFFFIFSKEIFAGCSVEDVTAFYGNLCELYNNQCPWWCDAWQLGQDYYAGTTSTGKCVVVDGWAKCERKIFTCTDLASVESVCSSKGTVDESPPICNNPPVEFIEYGKSVTYLVKNPSFDDYTGPTNYAAECTGADESGYWGSVNDDYLLKDWENLLSYDVTNSRGQHFQEIFTGVRTGCLHTNDGPTDPNSCDPPDARCYNQCSPKEGVGQLGIMSGSTANYSGDTWYCSERDERYDFSIKQTVDNLQSGQRYLFLVRTRGKAKSYGSCTGEGWAEFRVVSGKYDSGWFFSKSDDYWVTKDLIFVADGNKATFYIKSSRSVCDGWGPSPQVDWLELIELCGPSTNCPSGPADGVVLGIQVENGKRSEMQLRNIFPNGSKSGWGMIADDNGQITNTNWAPFSPKFFWKPGSANKVEIRFWNQRDQQQKVVNCGEYQISNLLPQCTVSGPQSVSVNSPATYTASGTNATFLDLYYAKENDPLCNKDSWHKVATGFPYISGNITFSETGGYYVVCNAYHLGLVCTGNPDAYICGGLSNCGPDSSLKVTVTEPGPWFQTQEGSVVGESVVSIIPSSCTTSCSPACFRFLSLQGDGGTSGVVGVKNSAHDLALGAGDVSQEGWLAENPFPKGIERSTYDYISNRLAYENLFTERKDFDCDIDGCPLPTQTGVYQKESSGTPIYLKGGNITNGNKVVIFINGDAGVKLTGNITVDNQSFFALMVKGNLIIDSTVTQAQGIFFSDNYIILLTSGGTDSQFIGEGSFVGRNGILIERNLKGNNTCKPAALFKERPDFAINLPADFAYNRSVFQEVAP